jgi:micrococcal nuclease
MASARWTRFLALGLTLAAAGCGSVANAQADRDCSDFPNQRTAQQWYDTHPGDPDQLDGDHNGTACDSLASTRKPRTAANGRRNARVVAIVDGDTIKVTVDGHRQTIRLIGIDTPESKRPETPVECGAKRAAAAMTQLLTNRSVTLRRDPTQDAIDRYGRTLAYVDFGGDQDAGETMIRNGWATPYVYQHHPFQRYRAYAAAAASAKTRHAGVQGICAGDFHRAR